MALCNIYCQRTEKSHFKNMRKHKGWIALDIDGTITDESHHAPKEVIAYLHDVQEEGWELVFITGRTFSFGYRVVQAFNFPFYLAVQNGADILHMPGKKQIARHYLDESVIPLLEKAYKKEEEDFLIYAGYEQGDFCYYRPHRFSSQLLAHVDKIMALSPERWKAVESFTFEKEFIFPLAKCLGKKAAMERIDAILQKVPQVAATLIKDPLGVDIYLILVTAKEATKGNALQAIQKIYGAAGPVIAAGDDLNDISMLQLADVKIVMSSAPSQMHQMADILAAHGKEKGIIDALNRAKDLI